MKNQKLLVILPVVLGTVILAVVAATALRDRNAALGVAETRLDPVRGDQPPEVDFTWTPSGAVTLREMVGKLSLKDDRALDFKTYKMYLVELDKTVTLPMAESLIGREYTDTLSFSLQADNPRLIGKDKLTVRIEIADNKGQKTEIERIIKLKPDTVNAQPVVK
jgi:hypothetical protein